MLIADYDGFSEDFTISLNLPSEFLCISRCNWRSMENSSVGLFNSTGSQGGGQETTPLTAITQLVHHGMIFVPIGYMFGAGMLEMEKIKGGSPYGAGTAGTFAGDGSQ
ncbi:unnamed protein product [Ilex paraguariensis]|uniref:NAD(P)H dehydrogenase (quinone) n=1 Tax=Ilex paraguariensis TaxID=185542 RepID=A0ABC8SH70_9AQUA